MKKIQKNRICFDDCVVFSVLFLSNSLDLGIDISFYLFESVCLKKEFFLND